MTQGEHVIRANGHVSSMKMPVLAHTLKTNFPLSLSHISFNAFINPVLYENLYFLIHITPWASPPIPLTPSYSLTRSLRLASPSLCSSRVVRLVCPSRVIRLVCVCPSNASTSVVSVHISCVCPHFLRLVCVRLVLSISCVSSLLLRLSVSCVCCVSSASVYLLRSSRLVSFNILSNLSGSIVYLPIHSNALKSISLKRLTGSTCLTGFEVMGSDGKCSECLRWVDWFKGFIHITP